jgi:hypothetical protein
MLQRVVGNRAVEQILARASAPVQPSGRGVPLQRVPLHQVTGGMAPAAAAKEYRQRTGLWAWQVNVGTLRFTRAAQGGQGEYTDVAVGSTAHHAEDLLLKRPGPPAAATLLADPNRGAAEVYTERHPCGHCRNQLDRHLTNPGDMVYWTNPVNNPDGSNPGQERMVARWQQRWQQQEENAMDAAVSAVAMEEDAMDAGVLSAAAALPSLSESSGAGS